MVGDIGVYQFAAIVAEGGEGEEQATGEGRDDEGVDDHGCIAMRRKEGTPRWGQVSFAKTPSD